VIALALLLALPGTAAAGEWVAGDLHIHTTYSHDSYGGPDDDNTGLDEAYTLGSTVEEQFQQASLRGLDYLAITDHNDIRSQTDPGFGAHGVLPVPAYENSLRGHAQMLGAEQIYDNGDESATSVNLLAELLRVDGGVFQTNHPADGSTAFPHDADWGYGYDVQPDTVEVWNISRLYQPPLPSGSSNDDAVRYWEGWLDRGAKVGATGGSDNHYKATQGAQGPGQPTTWVYSDSRSPQAVLEGLRAGRTFISHQPPGFSGPRLFLEADGNGDGEFEAMVGDTVPPGSRLRVRVENAPGALLRLITNGSRLAATAVPVTGPTFTHTLRTPSSSTWIRAELVDPDLLEARRASCDSLVGTQTTYCRNMLAVTAMTSAVYLRP
jgi:hypothetical protein